MVEPQHVPAAPSQRLSVEPETGAALRARDHAGRWAKGASGNPGGLSREIPPLVAEARRLALQHAPRAIERLADMLDDTDGRVVVAAATALLDRAGLRPYSLEPEKVEVTAVPVDVDALRAQLAVRVAGLAGPSERALPGGVPTPESARSDSRTDSQAAATPREPAGWNGHDGHGRQGGTA